MIKVQDWIASIPDEDKHIAYVGEGKSEQREFLLCGKGWETYKTFAFHLDMAFDPTSITTRDSRQVVQTTVNSTENTDATTVTADRITTQETYTVENVSQSHHSLSDIAPLSKTVTADGILLTWEVLRQHTVLPGKLWATIRAVGSDTQHIKKSAIMVFEVDPAICAIPAVVPPISEFEQMTAQMDNLRLQTEAAAQRTATYEDNAVRASTTATIAADAALNNMQLAMDAAATAQVAANEVKNELEISLRPRLEAVEKQANDLDEMQEDFNADLSRALREIEALKKHGGLTASQIEAIKGLFEMAAYTDDATKAYAAFLTAFGIGGEEPECQHNYVSVVTRAPTCTVEGVRTYTCSLCGDSYTEAILATGHNYVEGACSVCGEEDPNNTEEPDEPEEPTIANMFDKDTMCVDDTYINGPGKIQYNAGSKLALIPVEPNKTYAMNFGGKLNFGNVGCIAMLASGADTTAICRAGSAVNGFIPYASNSNTDKVADLNYNADGHIYSFTTVVGCYFICFTAHLDDTASVIDAVTMWEV